MGDRDPLQGRDVSFLSGMCKLISFVDRTRVESALTLAFLVSLAWVCALALLLRTTATHSVDAGSKPPPATRGTAGADQLIPEIKQPSGLPVGPSASQKRNVVRPKKKNPELILTRRYNGA
jgi:hypothetical protein